jgi:hypothetical protein
MYLGTPYGVPVVGTVLVMSLRCWRHPLRVQSRTTVMDTLLTKMPASAVKDRVRVTMTLWESVKRAHHLPIMRVGPVRG